MGKVLGRSALYLFWWSWVKDGAFMLLLGNRIVSLLSVLFISCALSTSQGLSFFSFLSFFSVLFISYTLLASQGLASRTYNNWRLSCKDIHSLSSNASYFMLVFPGYSLPLTNKNTFITTIEMKMLLAKKYQIIEIKYSPRCGVLLRHISCILNRSL